MKYKPSSEDSELTKEPNIYPNLSMSGANKVLCNFVEVKNVSLICCRGGTGVKALLRSIF